MRSFVNAKFLELLVVFGLVSSPALATPLLPQSAVEVSPPVNIGRTIAVAPGGNLQAALNAANPGDTIVLQAGARYSGPITLRRKSGTDWIQIVSSAIDGALPPRGVRVSPIHADLMPKIEAPNGDVALLTEAGAAYYWFRGIEVRPSPGTTPASTLFKLGSGNETSHSELPHHFVIEQSYFHGEPEKAMRRGIALNGNSIALVDSHFSEFKDSNTDSQALCGWNGAGPFLIRNNYLEGAGENVMFGGADPTVPGLTPADITFVHNEVVKPLSWVGGPWVIKNLFEVKHGNRDKGTGER